MTMTSTEFDRLITALTDGSHPKGKGQLLTEDGYCCLGVDCHVNGGLDLRAIPNPLAGAFAGAFATAASMGGLNFLDDHPDEVVQLLSRHFTHSQRSVLASINDNSFTFGPVVDWLNENRSQIVAD